LPTASTWWRWETLPLATARCPTCTTITASALVSPSVTASSGHNAAKALFGCGLGRAVSWLQQTGRGVRVAVIDSGIHAQHPHVGGIAGGAAIRDDDDPVADTTDRLGHGTAVAAAIHEKAQDAELYAVKVFELTLSTTAERLVRAIRWAAGAGADVINLSLGTHRLEHQASLAAAVVYAAERGSVIVAAEESGGVRWLPGSLDGVVPVRLDWECPRESFRVLDTPAGPRFLASGYPRPIPGVPPESNLKGISFAVANMSGLVARVREQSPKARARDVARILSTHRSIS
jgi:hypothetical protein